jgi:dipeptidyl aminopeptidase/acylaminoacyl peptidase
MRIAIILGLTLAGVPVVGSAAEFDAAAAFGARPSVEYLKLSPDGKSIAYLAPTASGQGSILNTLPLDKGAKSRRALVMDGKPTRLGVCNWVSNERLVCDIYGVVKDVDYMLPFFRVLAVNADGSNTQLLSTNRNSESRGHLLRGGNVIDWLPDEDGSVLMSREYLADDHTGSHITATKPGLGVDRVETRTGKTKALEDPKEGAVEYFTDGRGTLRIVGFRGTRSSATEMDTGVLNFQYRLPDSTQWRKLSSYGSNDSGFEPYYVDHDSNLTYGVKKKDGRLAIYTVKLDESLQEELVYANSEVDVTELIHIGRRNRVVGVAYTTDVTREVYFDEGLQKLTAALSKALPDHPSVRIEDSSVDETKLLIFASRDNNPRNYYLLDRTTHELKPLFTMSEELAGVTLARVEPVTFAAGDGTKIPGYLTYPPGKEKQKGLPAIVMPHGGPASRDSWGFDWLAQFYANRGFVVLQPNFRGSAGFGDAWYQDNGFRSWPIAIGDVLDAGRWLVSEGIADPSKLAIVGWSYGGYAALQSAVTDSSVFKAVVATAPVTDLNDLKEEARGWTNFALVGKMIGDAPREASPAQNAAKIKVPVLLFHGKMDSNVAIGESRHMDRSLTAAKVPHELVTWDDLDHQLDDSQARAEMLRKSEAFLRKNLNL